MLVNIESLAEKHLIYLGEEIEVKGLAPIEHILKHNPEADNELCKVLSEVILKIYIKGCCGVIQTPALQKALQQDIADSVREEVTADVSDELEKLYAS